jgi:very-short-patch-repair endonuclease
MARFEQRQQLITQLRLTERASAIRANPTTSEAALWAKLRANQLGVAFRRQFPVGRYIADFAEDGCTTEWSRHLARTGCDSTRFLVLRSRASARIHTSLVSV